MTRPGGVYVQNVIDYPPLRFIRSELATVAAEFRHVALIAPAAALAGQEGSNFLIVASDAPLPLEPVRPGWPSCGRTPACSRAPTSPRSSARRWC